ncbi:MAG TPA: undecaprenyl-diphosphatase [Candidatus Magasanikbacteria bacterium]|nr:MAG: hypothetical protein A3I74_00955 [Candidatus Magasanikbacteria bacterium RIFCSPLOWO2_02_FULL_47_16]OGH79985.1 MAG: hypothetical protein A3C10_02270 [Candidatus Magasanikbacteria bacterium RIFCSPHIGHO2_02_FULL_48_18]OGH83486.1 MAG: hypothetical protein A3G08_04135 [Candidatus Magasanikbacteria bacterium RIFCSPLOWO2_12_FULL_47_9b]HAZ28538.1 undecaprenyl-diphosphatase [Candidatus Magasanikbacteria bacterium]
MSIFHALTLGIIQGLTEFLPVSSSGHLIFLPKLFGWADQGLSFDVVVHLGTLVAVIFYFRKKLWRILKSFFVMDKGLRVEFSLGNEKSTSPHAYRKIGFFLILSIIPAGLVGFFFNDWVEQNLRQTWIIGASLIGWGLFLGLADFVSRSRIRQGNLLSHMTSKDALFIGCAQAIALIPGTSRSGITMTAGLFAKLDRQSAAEFSFLMSVPIIALAGGLKLFELAQTGLGDAAFFPLLVGFCAAAVSGFCGIWVLMRVIKWWSFLPFVVYRVLLGLGILLFFR